MTEILDEVAQAIYKLSPATQPWDGDPYEFHEPRAGHHRDKAFRQADAAIVAYRQALKASGAVIVQLAASEGDGWWPDAGWERWLVHLDRDNTIVAEPNEGVHEFDIKGAKSLAAALLAAASMAESL